MHHDEQTRAALGIGDSLKDLDLFSPHPISVAVGVTVFVVRRYLADQTSRYLRELGGQTMLQWRCRHLINTFASNSVSHNFQWCMLPIFATT